MLLLSPVVSASNLSKLTTQIDTELNQTKLTLAHGYAFTDNLFLVTEVSVVDATLEATGSADQDFESLQGAVELIFAF